jgi:hypothetical protein
LLAFLHHTDRHGGDVIRKSCLGNIIFRVLKTVKKVRERQREREIQREKDSENEKSERERR